MRNTSALQHTLICFLSVSEMRGFISISCLSVTYRDGFKMCVACLRLHKDWKQLPTQSQPLWANHLAAFKVFISCCQLSLQCQIPTPFAANLHHNQYSQLVLPLSSSEFILQISCIQIFTYSPPPPPPPVYRRHQGSIPVSSASRIPQNMMSWWGLIAKDSYCFFFSETGLIL